MQMQIRTSATHPLQIAEVATPSGGLVGVTFCPGKCGPSLYGHSWQRDLAVDLEAILQWGAKVVVTLVEPFELDQLKVAELGEQVRRKGMKWVHLPIVDVSAPTASFEAQWRDELPAILAVLQEPSNVLVHCKGGLGRAGTVAALLLIETGQSAEQAITKVRAVRPGAIETREQERYVRGYKRLSRS